MESVLSKGIVEEGRKQFEWAKSHMPALKLAKNYIVKNRGKEILDGIRLGACLHISKETAVLVDVLRSLGMKIDLVAANPLSTKDSIAAYLSSLGVRVRGRGSETEEEYRAAIESLANSSPQMIMDDGGELHVAYSMLNDNSCIGGTDETTSGTVRLKALEKSQRLRYPVIPVNEARTKHFFDNKYGTGQSSLDGLVRATGLLLAGKLVAVSGYGWVGRGVAERARGMGARVVVTEVDPVSALEAYLNGYEVRKMMDVVENAEIFLTCTGQTDVISKEHFKRMRSGAILGNCGHFDKEINIEELKAISHSERKIGRNISEYNISGKSIFLLCEGRVINLVAADGHPPEVMQLSFANQLLSINYLASQKSELKKEPTKVLHFPREIDDLVAKFALSSFNLKIDKLSSKQKRYAKTFTR
jgi:adenosylhomocysteinase